MRGHLQPANIVEMTINEFEEVFVTSFEASLTRPIIFEEYKRYIQDLKEVIKSPFMQWIDGSFINNRTLEPNDIDFVTIIDYDIYLIHEQEMDKRFNKFPARQFYEKLDAYILQTYPDTHEFHARYTSDYAYWYDFFTYSRLNRAKQRFNKGFIQLNFD